MKPDTTTHTPDVRHLNHPVWNRDKHTIRLWLCLIQLDKKVSHRHCDASMHNAKEMLGMEDRDFYEAVRNLMELGLLRFQDVICLDPRDAIPDDENSKPLILGVGSSK